MSMLSLQGKGNVLSVKCKILRETERRNKRDVSANLGKRENSSGCLSHVYKTPCKEKNQADMPTGGILPLRGAAKGGTGCLPPSTPTRSLN